MLPESCQVFGHMETLLPKKRSYLPPARMEWVSPGLLRLLRCPLCKGRLDTVDDALYCRPCDRAYPIVLGLPDLRVYEDPLIPLKDDCRKGEKVQAQAEKLDFAGLVRYYWSLPTYPYTPPELCERFIRHVLTDEVRIEAYREQIGHGEAGPTPVFRIRHSRLRAGTLFLR
jgi:uncharacterized protein YbaR (Trm112 family)